jgi:RNA polymerase sigma-70 factor, ECF subfamily
VTESVRAMESRLERSVPAAGVAEERELVRRCQEGEESAFRELLHRYRSRAVYLAAQILHDPTEAEDVVQEAFLHVFRSIRKFRGEASFYSWLFRIVVNLCMDRGRRLSGRVTVALDEDREEAAASGHWETRLQVDALLARLGDELRVTLVLREVGGLSYQEIARELKIPVGTVRSRLSAAREQFRRLWESMEAESA